MSNFPTAKKERTHWSVWRDAKWLGEWHGEEPRVGQKIKFAECLMGKTVTSVNSEIGRIFVK